MTIKKNRFLKNTHTFLCSIGLNLKKFFNIIFIFKYVKDLIIFYSKGGKVDMLNPIIGEHKDESGSFDKQYFYQDLIVAQEIYKHNPSKHVDIGSRIDGFVSNVASYRKIEIFDIRPNFIDVPNINVSKIDLTSISKELHDYSESISCLHSIEHLGLGRYGDNLDPDGYIKGIENLKNMLKEGGCLYLSIPIASKTKINFNSERIFNPFEILEINKDLELIKFHLIDDDNKIFLNYDIQNLKNKVINYSCGIFIFKK